MTFEDVSDANGVSSVLWPTLPHPAVEQLAKGWIEGCNHVDNMRWNRTIS